MATELTGVTKKRVLIETQVVVEPGATPWEYGRMTSEEKHKWLESWAKELMEFFRDHRHQDVNSVHAEPTYEVQCSGCGAEWEEMFDDEIRKACCASCGEPIAVCA
jgi:hypothetical protein